MASGHVLGMQAIVKTPMRMGMPDLIGKAAAATHDGDTPTAKMSHQFQPHRQQRIAVQATADLDYPHRSRSLAFDIGTVTLSTGPAARCARRINRRRLPSARNCATFIKPANTFISAFFSQDSCHTLTFRYRSVPNTTVAFSREHLEELKARSWKGFVDPKTR